MICYSVATTSVAHVQGRGLLLAEEAGVEVEGGNVVRGEMRNSCQEKSPTGGGPWGSGPGFSEA
jgi:hypothetical protein